MTRPAHSKEAPAGQGQGFENHGTAFGRSPVNKNDTEVATASQEGAEWEVRRSKALTSLYLLRKSLDNLEAGLAADMTAFGDRAPAAWGRLVAANLAREAEELRRVMTDVVDADDIESARIELAGRRALGAIRAARGGA